MRRAKVSNRIDQYQERVYAPKDMREKGNRGMRDDSGRDGKVNKSEEEGLGRVVSLYIHSCYDLSAAFQLLLYTFQNLMISSLC